jgi:arylsulfatase A-like enzyme
MTMDLFPTFAKLAGAELSALPRLDGIDLMPLLEGGKPGTGRTLHWLFGDTWAVREGPWKLIGKGAEASFLADLDADPAEKSNRLGEQRAIADKLTASHRQWIAETGDR